MSLLEARGLSVRFGGHMAVIEADLDVEAGEIYGLIGPNGAGKTTVFNALTGMQEVLSGRVTLRGVDITGLATHRRARLGLARTFQRLELFGSLTTRENLQVAAEYRAGLGGFDHPEQRVDEVVDLVGLGPIAGARAETLSTGDARLVELGRALVTGPEVLLLDEPASGLDDRETVRIIDILRLLVTDGMGILLVEHDMSVVMTACSRIFVMDFGRVIAVGTPEEVRHDEAVMAAYLGSRSAGA